MIVGLLIFVSCVCYFYTTQETYKVKKWSYINLLSLLIKLIIFAKRDILLEPRNACGWFPQGAARQHRSQITL